jgi:bacillithiol biosynthesis cysteine-adding enzyme BshC
MSCTETFKERDITEIANGSSWSETSPAELPKVDLLKSGRLPSLASAFLEGRDLDLLEPLRFNASECDSPDFEPGLSVDRTDLARALSRENLIYGHSKAAELAAKLALPETRVVITGQQPGLFAGPLYTLSKAVAAQRWAERLEDQGQPAVALFWMATEDHDFKESSEVAFYSPKGPLKVSLGEDREPLVPVGLRQFGPEIERVFKELSEAIPGDRFAEWLQVLETWYQPDQTFGLAFAQMITYLLGDRSPLLIDAMLPELKQAQRPLLRKLVEQRGEVEEAFQHRDELLERRGHPLQIRPQRGTSPLFLLHEKQRRRIIWTSSDGVGLRGVDSMNEPVEWLLEIIDSDPDRVSPGARARIAIQDAIFGTDLLILGPGELSYLPQAIPLYEFLGISPPTVALRPQSIVLEEHQIDKMSKSGLSLEQLTAGSLNLDEALADSEETEFLESASIDLEVLLEQLARQAIEIDADLEKPWSKTRDQMQRALQSFSNRVTAASGRRDEVVRRRAESLREVCMPLGRSQERVIASAHFPGKYDERFVEALFGQLELDPVYMGVVRP